MVSHQNIMIYRGSDKSWLGYVKRSDTGVAESIVGCSFSFIAKDRYGGVVFLQRTLDVIDEPTGVTRLLLNKADTDSLLDRDLPYKYQIVMTNADGKIYPVTEGDLLVKPSHVPRS